MRPDLAVGAGHTALARGSGNSWRGWAREMYPEPRGAAAVFEILGALAVSGPVRCTPNLSCVAAAVLELRRRVGELPWRSPSSGCRSARHEAERSGLGAGLA